MEVRHMEMAMIDASQSFQLFSKSLSLLLISANRVHSPTPKIDRLLYGNWLKAARHVQR